MKKWKKRNREEREGKGKKETIFDEILVYKALLIEFLMFGKYSFAEKCWDAQGDSNNTERERERNPQKKKIHQLLIIKRKKVLYYFNAQMSRFVKQFKLNTFEITQL